MLKVTPVLSKWVESIDLADTRVINFPSYIFLCGGKLAASGSSFYGSCRDIFYSYVKSKDDSICKNIVLAEKVIEYFDGSGYPDLLTFEKDLAAISLLTVVFSESAGAIAELGSFSVLDNIQDRLVVVLHEDDVSSEKSFIWKGPIKYLKNRAFNNGSDNPIYVYNWKRGVENDEYKDDDFPDASGLYQALREFLEKRKSTSLWKSEDVGHIMLLIASSLSVMQIATVEEFRLLLELFGLNKYVNNVDQYLSLLKALGLVGFKHYGNSDFFIIKKSAIDWLQWSYKKKSNAFLSSSMFVEFYKKNQDNKVKAWRSFHNNL